MRRPSLNERQRNRLDWLMQLAYITLRLFARNGLQNHAAATAFYFMLSATPLLLILSYGLGALAHLAEHSNLAVLLLSALHAQLHIEFLHDTGIIPREMRLAASGVSLLTLLLASRGLLSAIQTAFVVIFPAEAKRQPVASAALPLLILPLVSALVVLAGLAEVAIHHLFELALFGRSTAHLLEMLSGVIGIFTLWGLIFTAYWRLPIRRPASRDAAILAALCTLSLLVLAELFGHLFRIEDYQAIYGALGGVVFVLIGAFAAWLVFYFWAQCLFALSKVDVAALEWLLLGDRRKGAHRLESYVFARSNRLLDEFGRGFAVGEVLIREGERSENAYFLYSGRVKLYRTVGDTDIPLGTLTEGELFGEMAYLLGEERTATAVAETDGVVLVLPPGVLEDLMRSSAPLSRRIIGVLCQRLKKTNLTVRGGSR